MVHMPLKDIDKERINQIYMTTKPAYMTFKDMNEYTTMGSEIVRPILGLAGTVPSDEQVKQKLAGLDDMEKNAFKQLIQLFKEVYPGVDESVDGLVTYRGFQFRQNGSQLLKRAKEAWSELRKLAKLVADMIDACRPAASANTKTPEIKAGSFSKTVGLTAGQSHAQRMYRGYLDKFVNFHRYQKVKTIVGKLNNAVNNEHFEVVCDGDPTNKVGPCGSHALSCGFVDPSDGCNRFYIGPRFFDGMSSEITGGCGQNPQGAGNTYIQKRSAVETAMTASICTAFHELTHIGTIGALPAETGDNQYEEAWCRKQAWECPTVAGNNAANYELFAKAVLMMNRFSTDITDGLGKA